MSLLHSGLSCLLFLPVFVMSVEGHVYTRLMPEDRRQINKMLSKDMSLPPFYDTGNRTDIEIAIIFSDMRVYDKADVKFSFYLYQKWFDHRLVTTCNSCESFGPANISKAHVVDHKYWKNLWLPETYIENADATKYHGSVMTNQFVWLLTNGTIFHGLRLDVRTHCRFGRMVFPVAKYICNLKFRVHSYGILEVTLDWFNKNYINFIEGFNEGGTKMTKYQKRFCREDYTAMQDSACLELIIYVERNLGQNFLRLYMPSVFIILTGWLSFWIDRKEASARVKFGTLCILAMITEDAGIQFLMAGEVHSSALDVWFAVCLVFATIVPVEYTIVHAIDRYKRAMTLMEEGKKAQRTCNHCLKEISISNHLLSTSASPVAYSLNNVTSYDLHQLHCKKPQIKYEFVKRINTGEIEKYFRILYALSFISFMIFYWCFYLNYEEEFS